ncbi:MAG: hypothetical protein SGJ21_16665 [Alphaproteobacteria bacterium]|nr:hypothetical protein [Alphaproteobacteria bacterium]
MTETLDSSGIAARTGAILKRLVGLMARAGFGVFLLTAAVFALVATTFIGIMLAIAALCLGLARGSRRGGAPRRPGRNGEPATLEAHRTADGWVIEPHGAPVR